jgi:hypothetical protein
MSKNIVQVARNSLALGNLCQVFDFSLCHAQLPIGADAFGKVYVREARSERHHDGSGPEPDWGVKKVGINGQQ